MNKVCITGPGRCGSTLLTLSLCQHPNIINNKSVEPWCPVVSQFRYYHKYIIDHSNRDISQCKFRDEYQECLDFMDSEQYFNYVFQQEDVVKILHGHLSLNIINYLKKRNDIRVIHLCRKNLLASFVSAGLLYNKIHNDDKSNKIHIDINVLRYYVMRTMAVERKIDIVFEDKIHKIYYENMIDSWNLNIRNILSFINVPYTPIEMATSKNKHSSLIDSISNPEILGVLANEPYRMFANLL